MFNKVDVSTCFPGVAGCAGVCSVSKAKANSLDKMLENLKAQAAAGDAVQLPILLDPFGNTRPMPTGQMNAAAPAFYSSNAFGVAVKYQVEFYFSFDNMCRDIYLR